MGLTGLAMRQGGLDAGSIFRNPPIRKRFSKPHSRPAARSISIFDRFIS